MSANSRTTSRTSAARVSKAAAEFLTKSFLPFIRKHHPPMRVLLAGLITFTSYVVSNIWKEEIDAELKTYKTLRDKIVNVGPQIAAFYPSRLTDRYQYETVRIQRQILRQASGAGDVENEEEFSHEDAVTDFEYLWHEKGEFEDHQLRLLSIAGDPLVSSVLKQEITTSDFSRIFDDIVELPRCVESKMPKQDALKVRYQRYMKELRIDNIPFFKPFDEPLVSIENVLHRFLESTFAKGDRIINASWRRRPEDESPAAQREDRRAFERLKKEALNCRLLQNMLLKNIYSAMPRVIGEKVEKLYINPREKAKNQIDVIEKALYGLSGFLVVWGWFLRPEAPTPKRYTPWRSGFRNSRVRRDVTLR